MVKTLVSISMRLLSISGISLTILSLSGDLRWFEIVPWTFLRPFGRLGRRTLQTNRRGHSALGQTWSSVQGMQKWILMLRQRIRGLVMGTWRRWVFRIFAATPMRAPTSTWRHNLSLSTSKIDPISYPSRSWTIVVMLKSDLRAKFRLCRPSYSLWMLIFGLAEHQSRRAADFTTTITTMCTFCSRDASDFAYPLINMLRNYLQEEY